MLHGFSTLAGTMIVVRHLMNLLLSELEVQDELLGLLIRERVAIAKQSQDEMDSILTERESLERKLDVLMSRRDGILRSLESQLNLNESSLSLDSLFLLGDGELELLGESLSSSFHTIYDLKVQNKMLRAQTLSNVNSH